MIALAFQILLYFPTTPIEKSEMYAKVVPFSKTLGGGESPWNPASNICSPDGAIKGKALIRIGTGQRRYEL